MSDAEVLVSVRGRARTLVQPDSADLQCQVRIRRASKAAALVAAAQAVDELTGALAERGGRARTPETARHALTWSTQSASTHRVRARRAAETDDEPRPRRFEAIVDIEVVLRTLAELDALGELLAGQPTVHVSSVSWHVDEDNAAWPGVRADAIRAALAKAADYAAALGGSVARVEQVADAGLLGDEGRAHRAAGGVVLDAMEMSGGHGDAPTLDPVPQELVATIDARVVAAVPSAKDA